MSSFVALSFFPGAFSTRDIFCYADNDSLYERTTHPRDRQCSTSVIPSARSMITPQLLHLNMILLSLAATNRRTCQDGKSQFHRDDASWTCKICSHKDGRWFGNLRHQCGVDISFLFLVVRPVQRGGSFWTIHQSFPHARVQLL